MPFYHFNFITQISIESALQSQATIQLKKQYCDENRCLECAIGFELLKGN